MVLTVNLICAILVLPVVYFSMVRVQAPSPDEKYCPPGTYRASTDICCTLCMAGKCVLDECTSNGGDSTCGSCADGKTFTDKPNSLRKCNYCSSCGAEEEEVLPCTSTRDTVCQCKESYYRSKYSDKCEKTNTTPGYFGGVAITILILLIGVVIFALGYFLRKRKRGGQEELEAVPLLKRFYNDEQSTSRQKLIKVKKTELHRSISKHLQHLLDELERKGTISRSFYLETKRIPSSLDSAANLIQHFLNNGETACQNLLDALYATKDKYPDLTEWLDFLEHTSIVVIEGRSVRLIRRNKHHLKQWIGTDPDYLVEEVERRRFIPMDVCSQAKEQFNSLEVTGFLLHYIIDCGEDKCKEFLKLLGNVSRYPEVNKWLRILDMKVELYKERTGSSQDEKARIVVVQGNALHLIRGKKPELKHWIGKDTSKLLDKLKTRGQISEHVLSKAIGISDEVERAGFILDHFIDGRERKCYNLLETLRDLKETYPQLNKWLDSLENNSQIVVVQEGTWEKFKRTREDLMEWIAKDPWTLLDELDSKWYIQRHIYHTARDIKDKRECASFILDHFISGEEAYQKLLVALMTVKKHYDQGLYDWLSSLGLIKEATNTNVLVEKTIVVVPGNAEHVIRGKKPELKSWLSSATSPLFLLNELKDRGHISEHVHSKAKNFPTSVEQAGFLLDHFIDGGEKKCQKLLETLQHLQDKYPAVRKWLDSLENMQEIVFVKEGTREKVTEAHEHLKAWIAEDPWTLLDELDSKWYIQRDVYHTARDIEDKRECASFIVDHFISGEEDHQKLLVALKAVNKHYDQGLCQWLNSMELTLTPGSPIATDEPLANPAGYQSQSFMCV